MADCVADWEADWVADWVADWEADCVADWVAGWLGDCFIRQSVSDSRKDGSSVLEDEEDMVLMRLTEGVLQEG